VSPGIRKVLLVDDDADLRRLGKLSLSKVGGWEVVVAASGPEAVALAASELPDVVLLDVSMPGMDGPTVLRTLRDDPRTAHLPVVFVTARALPEEIRSLVAAGAVGVITKPFDAMKLPAQIRGLLSLAPGEAPPAVKDSGAMPAGLLAGLAAQRAAYVAKLPGRVEVLAAALDRARADRGIEILEDARTLAHKLRGSAGSHGMDRLSEAAGRIEEALRRAGGVHGEDAWDQVDKALAAVRAELP
jgi:two-component system OmpR family response regulator